MKSKHYLTLAVVVLTALSCSSAPGKAADSSELVKVATITFVNTTGQESHDYLSGSITDATTKSMEQIFVYRQIPASSTVELYARMKQAANLSASELRSAALSLDADLLIYGDFKVSKGKKGDAIEIRMHALRSDRGEVIAALNRQTNVSNRIFDDIDKMTEELVQSIVAYRKKQMAESGQRDIAIPKGAKIELTRDSINIAPFIPPIF